MQSAFYPTVQNTYGVPLDTRHTYTKGEATRISYVDILLKHHTGDWELFAAAVASTSTRDMFIQLLANWINVTPTNRALTDLYDTTTGK